MAKLHLGRPRGWRPLLFLFALLFVGWSTEATCLAGGGPENVLLVVNPLRMDSMTIANHYVALRQIPANNLFYLPWEGQTEKVTVDEFRARILTPILDEIKQRRLRHVDTIVYSAGYPFSVDITADLAGPVTNFTGPLGSLTGLTYLAPLVMRRDAAYIYSPNNTRSNYYESTRTLDFSIAPEWIGPGKPIEAGGRRYYLSVMLGYTDGRGNRLDEIISYLQRSALADGTRPSGTVYLMKNGDIRSQTRDPLFPHVLAALESEDVACKILEGTLPSSRKDVMGAVVGRATFDWDKSLCTIRPGAICEHLTSFGGDLRKSAGQTPFTEHLRHGAAGSSGTVTEPLAIPEKFPRPWIQVHYARGATLAEAFYQSVASPYQLLIAGDPLCRPWARIPRISLDGLAAGDVVHDVVRIAPTADKAVPVSEFRLFVDGQWIGACAAGGAFELDTKKLSDGYHEIRVVGLEASMIRSQGRLILPIQVANLGQSIQASVHASNHPGRVNVWVESPGAKSVYIFHNRRPVGRVFGERGVVAVDAQTCGRGPVTLSAIALENEGSEAARVYAQPIHCTMPETFDVQFTPRAIP